MIGKALQNNNFRETTQYVLDKEEARLLGGTVMGDNSDTISREFLMSRDLSPDIQRPVYHLIDSYSYSDTATRTLSDEFLKERAIEHFAGLVVSAREPELLRQEDKTEYKQKVEGFIDSELYEYQFFVAVHEDRDHTHTHLVASRINLIDGRCIPTWQDKERSHRICREIEKDYGLQQLQSYYEVQRKSITRGQREEWEKTGVPPVMVQMQKAINQVLRPGHSLEQVREALQTHYGIASKLTERGGRQGIVFEMANANGEIIRMSGSQLGRGYTLSALQGRLERASEVVGLEVETDQARGELDQLRSLLQEHEGYAQRLVQQMQEIWGREITVDPEVQSVEFEEYSIRRGEEGEPELYRGDLQLLGFVNREYRRYGTTEEDCTAMERFNEFSRQQVQTQLRQLEVQQETEQQRDADAERQREKYRKLYEQYLPPRAMEPEEQDFVVAVRALRDRHGLAETAVIVANGPHTQEIKQKKGKDNAWEYAKAVALDATRWLEREQAKQQQNELG